MDKQALRNELSNIEDEARKMLNSSSIHFPREEQLLNLFVRLTMAVRQDIVK